MTSFTQNLTAADRIARYTIEQRVQDAEQRAQTKALRSERRAQRRAVRRAGRRAADAAFATSVRQLPSWALRFAHPRY